MNQIYVKIQSAGAVAFDIRNEDKISQLKNMIEVMQNIPMVKQSLIYDGHLLSNDKSLADYNIKRGIHCVKFIETPQCPIHSVNQSNSTQQLKQRGGNNNKEKQNTSESSENSENNLGNMLGGTTGERIEMQPKLEFKPQQAFIISFVRSCLLIKYTDQFDIIDFTNIFKQLASPSYSPSFEKLQQLYAEGKQKFEKIMNKYLEQLHQIPSRYPVESIIKCKNCDFDLPSANISCLDPISLAPLESASRGIHCTHVQCLNSTSISNFCPLCKKLANIILLDILAQKLVWFVRAQNKGREVKSVEVDYDFFKIIRVNVMEEEEDEWFCEKEKNEEIEAKLKEQEKEIEREKQRERGKEKNDGLTGLNIFQFDDSVISLD